MTDPSVWLRCCGVDLYPLIDSNNSFLSLVYVGDISFIVAPFVVYFIHISPRISYSRRQSASSAACQSEIWYWCRRKRRFIVVCIQVGNRRREKRNLVDILG